jgi:hypothetical protein
MEQRRIFHFPTPRQLTLRWPGIAAETSRTEVLTDAGLLFKVSTCHISTDDLHIYPILRGSTEAELNAPRIFLSDKIPTVTDYETHQLQELTPLALKHFTT